MNSFNPFRTLFISGSLVALTTWQLCQAEPPASNRITITYEEVIKVKRKGVPEGVLYGGRYSCTLADANGKRRANLTAIVQPVCGQTWIKIVYPSVAENDVIPFFGRVCEVGNVAANSLLPDGLVSQYDDAPGRLHLRVLSDEECVAKLGNADSTKMVATSVVIPVGARFNRDDDFRDRGVTDHLRFKTLFRIRNPAIHIVKGRTECELPIEAFDRKGYGPDAGGAVLRQVAKIGVGDAFVIPENGKGMVPRKQETWKVRDIVVPSPEKQVIGWVALEPDFEGWPREEPPSP